MYITVLSAKWRPFCPRKNDLIANQNLRILLLIWSALCVLLWIVNHCILTSCRHYYWGTPDICRPAFMMASDDLPPNMRQSTLQWSHNERDGVSNHQPHDYLLNRLFRHKSKKTSKLRVTGLCAVNSPVTGEFPAQMASNAENYPVDDIICYHHGDLLAAQVSRKQCNAHYIMRYLVSSIKQNLFQGGWWFSYLPDIDEYSISQRQRSM